MSDYAARILSGEFGYVSERIARIADEADAEIARLSGELKSGLQALQDTENEVKELEAKLAGAMAALQELVALKALKDSIAQPCWPSKEMDDYKRRKPLAWEAARAALASMTQADTIVGEGEHGKRE